MTLEDVRVGRVRTLELNVTVSHFLEGSVEDWPSNIQDGVYAALERKAVETALPLVIVKSHCDVDHDKEEGEDGRFFLRVIASEVVMSTDVLSGNVTRH